MRTIVFLDCHKIGSSREAVRAAANMGYSTVLLTDRKAFVDARAEFEDVDEMIYTDLSDAKKLVRVIRKLQSKGHHLKAIVSFIEPHVSKAARLHNRFCGGGRLSVDAMAVMEDKVSTRDALVGTPYNPAYTVYGGRGPVAQLSRSLTYPVVMKRPGSAGSKDVIRAFSAAQFRHRIRQLTNKYPGQRILIEEYIRGPQYLVEVLVEDRTIHIIAIVEQHMLNHRGRMIVAGYAVLVSPPRELLDSLRETVQDIVMRMGLENGPCHIELRRRHDGWKVIEINPRMSGSAMNRMIDFAYGVDLAEQTLRLYLGKNLHLQAKAFEYVYAQFVTAKETGLLESVEGRAHALNVPRVREVFIKPTKGQRIQKPKSMGHRYAYVIASDEDSLELARRAAERAAGYIRFRVQEGGEEL
ncbi:ATP-grasp domain-containing protein [Alicyclobacillus fastidiosus]|uniref:ATP-grasp domain-containing protein n=1 Tax=Alicyclobacillus fastidiosus TaxID=392011 RepID=A0ABV5AD54_9BACL|nr:ATP-grasp domain-containing protein [Alicyclobacillus fastidiosus]WEH08832.1 ATP-grasp domain-containing protein [Alicyclobacillus fastidiosus]